MADDKRPARRYRRQIVLIGILSDTHDRPDPATAGVQQLLDAGAQHLIHCGDVGGERILDLLAGHPATLVWGNNDWDRRGLARYANAIGLTVFDQLAELELDGKKIAVTHGDDAAIVSRILDQQEHDYLLVGHSHVRADHRVGRVRMINPGALHRAAEKTVALLDTKADRLQFMRL